MQGIIELIKSMPAYMKYLFTKHTVIACIAALVFIFVLFFSNRVAKFLRTLFVIAILALIGTAYITDRRPLLCLSILTLAVLIVIRLIKYIFTTIRTNRRNKRIEQRALEKAAQRRGSFKNKQGYSGERKPIEPDYVPEKMDHAEIEDVIRFDKADKPAAAPVTEELKPEDAENEKTK